MDENLYRPIKLAPKRDRLKSAKNRFEKAGGQVEHLQPQREEPRKEFITEPGARYCFQCSEWHKGAGTKNCLKCRHYKEFQINSSRRPTISYDIAPQAIMEAYEDPRSVSIISCIKQLPIDLSAPLMMQYLIGATLQEIADYLHTSRQAVYKKNKFTLEIINKMMK